MGIEIAELSDAFHAVGNARYRSEAAKPKSVRKMS
jgi:hypothetical protein